MYFYDVSRPMPHKKRKSYLLYSRNVFGDVLHTDRVLDGETMALAFDPRAINQDPSVRRQA